MNLIFIGKKHFLKIPLSSRIYADFEAYTKFDLSSIGNKTANIYRQNCVCNGNYIMSELDDVSQVFL